jgi:hypothetical protein
MRVDRTLLQRLHPVSSRPRRSLASRLSDHPHSQSYYVADADSDLTKVTLPHPPTTHVTNQGRSGVQ